MAVSWPATIVNGFTAHQVTTGNDEQSSHTATRCFFDPAEQRMAHQASPLSWQLALVIAAAAAADIHPHSTIGPKTSSSSNTAAGCALMTSPWQMIIQACCCCRHSRHRTLPTPGRHPYAAHACTPAGSGRFVHGNHADDEPMPLRAPAAASFSSPALRFPEERFIH